MEFSSDAIETFILILYLIPIYLFFKGFSYKIGVKIIWGEENFYKKKEFRELMNLFVYTKLCPSPELNADQREKWASLWWVYLMGSITSAILLTIVGEIMFQS